MGLPAIPPLPAGADMANAVNNGTLCCLKNPETLLPGLSAAMLAMLVASLSKQRYSPKTKKFFKKKYDYIIVGAGSAGCALAARLSEKKCVSVLLLEAGGEPMALSEMPGIARLMTTTEMNWNFFTVPQKHSGHCVFKKKVPMPTGKVIGGCSILNAMLFIRGNHKDYRYWQSRSHKWSWPDVLHYYLKLENNVDKDIANNGYHAVGGPVTYSRLCYNPKIKRELLKAVKKLGYPYRDPNGATQIGFSDYQANIRKGQRCSAAKAYLVPADHRKNLDIVPNAYVRKVVFVGKRARGVYVDHKKSRYFIRARKEVILSAGAMKTPQILMLSGIGPKRTLRKHNIPVIVDLPSVGKNFQDHCAVIMNYEIKAPIRPYLVKLVSPENVLKYVKHRCGPMTSTEGVCLLAFQRSENSTTPKGVPNYQLYFVEGAQPIVKLTAGMRPECYNQVYAPYELKTTLWCASSILRPKSKGYVSIRSNDPYDQPIIDPNFFHHPDDVKDVIAGMKMCNKVCLSSSMKKFGAVPFTTLMPGCEHLVDNKDKYMDCYARAFPFSLSHFAGSCKMGHPKDPNTVVDYELRVKGVHGLRVADASIMPEVTSGNTHTPCMMIGEKAADIIKRTIKCDHHHRRHHHHHD